jgi:methylmalonyl-CoA mutase N-terminal domain/subunit
LTSADAQTSEPKTLSGIEVKRFYPPGESPPLREQPGEYPYTRGIFPEMYRKKALDNQGIFGIRDLFRDKQEAEVHAQPGTDGTSLAFDLPTQLGLDSDNPRSMGEIGRVGVAVSILDDVQDVFRGVDLSKVSTSMTINSTAPILFSMYAAVADSSGVPRNEVRGLFRMMFSRSS